MTTLRSKPVAGVLSRLHARADREDPAAKARVDAREAELGRRLPAAQRYELYGDAPLSISREVGELYYLLTGCTTSSRSGSATRSRRSPTGRRRSR